MQLATTCLDKLFARLSDDSVSKLWRAKGMVWVERSKISADIHKAASYSTSRSRSSFLSYFASTTPESEHKQTRLKTILFLQGSPYLDLDAIRARIQQHQKILQLEYAVIEGKVRYVFYLVVI
jgi:vacuolar protein sorting-associated protein 3